MSENETIVRVVPFSKAKEWHDWKKLVLARVNRKDPELGRYFNLSKPYPLTKMEGSEEVVNEEKLKIKRRAYDELLMSMSNATNDGKQPSILLLTQRTKMEKEIQEKDSGNFLKDMNQRHP